MRRSRRSPMAASRCCAAAALAAHRAARHDGERIGLDQLHAFLEGTQSAQGSFRQSVVNKDGARRRRRPGHSHSSAPGKFRWTYDKPFDQLIVGDGEKVWVYDRDLNQVIVRKLDAALGATPAALLAGDNALEKNFTLVAGGDGGRPRIRERNAEVGRIAVHAHPAGLRRQPAAHGWN